METAYSNLEQVIANNSLLVVVISSLLLFGLAILSLLIKHQSPRLKVGLFGAITAVIIASTLYLVGSTIYLNVVSLSKGPVHYHADFEIWSCDKRIDPVNPKGLSNKIGTATLHEHNDNRIHLEGVVVEQRDASLGKFFKVIGGEIDLQDQLNYRILILPLDGGVRVLGKTGNSCKEGEPAILQVFVYQTVGAYYKQTKIENPQNYIISPQTSVPPGDCIIIEEDILKDKTDKLCQSFKAAKQIGKLKGEIK